MSPTEIDNMSDTDEISISGADAKRLLYMCRMLRSGLVPKNGMEQVWGEHLIAILRNGQEWKGESL